MPHFDQSAKLVSKPSSFQLITTAHRGADKLEAYKAELFEEGWCWGAISQSQSVRELYFLPSHLGN